MNKTTQKHIYTHTHIIYIYIINTHTHIYICIYKLYVIWVMNTCGIIKGLSREQSDKYPLS